MGLALIATVSLGCFVMASLVLADDYLRRDFRRFPYNKGLRLAQRRGPYNNQGNKGGNVGRYHRVIYPYRGKHGSPKAVNPYSSQPSVDPNNNQPSVNPYNNQPSINPYNNQSSVDPYNNQSSVNPYNNQPPVDPYNNQPSVNPYNNQPSVDPYNNQPVYVGSKTANNEYNDSRQGNGPYGAQDNKAGNTDLYTGIDPSVVNQGRLTGLEVNNKQPDNADLYTGIDPFVVKQGKLTGTAINNKQPSYIGNDPYIKNIHEYDQYNNQNNKGGNIGAYTVAGVYDGNQEGPKMVDNYDKQPVNAGGILDGNTYSKNSNNGFDDTNVYNNAP